MTQYAMEMETISENDQRPRGGSGARLKLLCKRWQDEQPTLKPYHQMLYD